MIAYVSGFLAVKEPTHLVVECHGVGYLVKISLNTYTAVKDLKEALIHTHFQVKEDGQVLFGFHDPKERGLFELLVSVSGVGGSTALNILSSLAPAELEQTIARQDVALLKKIKGIGQKTAERIVLELKDKMKGQFGPTVAGAGAIRSTTAPAMGPREEVLIALTNLGFARAQIEKKVDDLIASGVTDSALLIKAVLRG